MVPLLNFLSVLKVPDTSMGHQSSWLEILYYIHSYVVYDVWPEAIKSFIKTTHLNLTETGTYRENNVLLSGRAGYEQLARWQIPVASKIPDTFVPIVNNTRAFNVGDVLIYKGVCQPVQTSRDYWPFAPLRLS